MKIFKLSIGLVSASVLTACGGASSSSPQPPAASKMAAYVGVWSTPCDVREMTTLTVTEAGAKDTLTVVPKTEYFAQAGCTGAVLATETQSGNYTIAYSGVANAGVVFTAGASSVTTKVELVTIAAPALTVSFTGTAVTRTTTNGRAQWCVDFGGGNTMCVNDEGPQAAMPPTNTALHVNGNKLYTLTANGNIYGVEEVFTKR